MPRPSQANERRKRLLPIVAKASPNSAIAGRRRPNWRAVKAREHLVSPVAGQEGDVRGLDRIRLRTVPLRRGDD